MVLYLDDSSFVVKIMWCDSILYKFGCILSLFCLYFNPFCKTLSKAFSTSLEVRQTLSSCCLPWEMVSQVNVRSASVPLFLLNLCWCLLYCWLTSRWSTSLLLMSFSKSFLTVVCTAVKKLVCSLLCLLSFFGFGVNINFVCLNMVGKYSQANAALKHLVSASLISLMAFTKWILVISSQPGAFCWKVLSICSVFWGVILHASTSLVHLNFWLLMCSSTSRMLTWAVSSCSWVLSSLYIFSQN